MMASAGLQSARIVDRHGDVDSEHTSISSEPQRRGEGRHELRNPPRFAPRQRRRYLHTITTHALAIGSGEGSGKAGEFGA